MATPLIVTAGSCAQQFGVKSLVFGPPGKGKTPLINTAPNPIICLSESGTLSLRGSNVAAIEAYTPEAIKDFYDWLGSSAEARQFHTVGVDSLTQQCQIILQSEMPKHKDPRKAYGVMFDTMMKYINQLYFTKEKHTYLICKQTVTDEGGINVRLPAFPGNAISTEIRHLFDEILHLDLNNVPGQTGAVLSFRCHASYDCHARDRSGRLAEFEPPNLTQLFNKILQG